MLLIIGGLQVISEGTIETWRWKDLEQTKEILSVEDFFVDLR